MSSAVRPMALSPDERTAYLQLSFLHGFVEFDLATDKPLRIAELPLSEEARNTPREEYLLDSAHHGIAMNPEGTKLCVAGTMSDYAAIVQRDSFAFNTFPVGRKPYWSTNSGDGRTCFVSASGDDQVVALDYASEQEVARIPVGDHPQRMRMGVIRSEDAARLPASPAGGAGSAPGSGSAARPRAAAKLRVLRARVRRGKLDLRLQMTSRATGTLAARYVSSGRRTSFSLPIRRRGASAGKPLTWTVRRALPGAQRRKRTGILELRYAGNARVRPDRLRSRAAKGRSRLRRTASAIDDQGTLRVAGTITRRARGIVRIRLGYVSDGSDATFLGYRARIRRGRWELRESLPSKAARSGGDLSIQFTGHERRRLRGEQVTKAVAP